MDLSKYDDREKCYFWAESACKEFLKSFKQWKKEKKNNAVSGFTQVELNHYMKDLKETYTVFERLKEGKYY